MSRLHERLHELHTVHGWTGTHGVRLTHDETRAMFQCSDAETTEANLDCAIKLLENVFGSIDDQMPITIEVYRTR